MVEIICLKRIMIERTAWGMEGAQKVITAHALGAQECEEEFSECEEKFSKCGSSVCWVKL